MIDDKTLDTEAQAAYHVARTPWRRKINIVGFKEYWEFWNLIKFCFWNCSEREKNPRSPVNSNLTPLIRSLLLLLLLVELRHVQRLVDVLKKIAVSIVIETEFLANGISVKRKTIKVSSQRFGEKFH